MEKTGGHPFHHGVKVNIKYNGIKQSYVLS